MSRNLEKFGDGVSINGELYFSGRDTISNTRGIIVTDGTPSGTRMLSDPDDDYSDAVIEGGMSVGGVYIFPASFSIGGVSSVTSPDGSFTLVNKALANAGSISGTVFQDANVNGARDASDRALPGHKVFIDRNNDGICNKNEIWTRASSTGRYRFDFLRPGNYVIRVVGLSGERGSTADSYQVHLAPNATVTRNFGRTSQALVTGLIYMDANKNGTIDNGESGMGGWTVFVDANDDGILDDGESSAVTDAGGKFAISVAAGSWKIRAVPQGKYRQTSPGAGYRSVSTVAGQILAKVNFGEKRVS